MSPLRPHGWWRAVFPPEELQVYDLYRPPLDRSLDRDAAAVLLVVDATEEFLGPRRDVIEAARETPTACGRVAWDAVDQIARLVDAFRNRGLPIVFTIPDWTLQDAVGAATAGPARAPHAVSGAMPPILEARSSEPVLARSKPSAFFGTALTSMLIRWKRRVVVVVGGTTSGCVRATVVDASSYGFDV